MGWLKARFGEASTMSGLGVLADLGSSSSHALAQGILGYAIGELAQRLREFTQTLDVFKFHASSPIIESFAGQELKPHVGFVFIHHSQDVENPVLVDPPQGRNRTGIGHR